MKEMNEIWETALGYLQTTVSPKRYNELFGPEVILHTERRGSTFYICVCDSDHLAAISDFHYADVENALFISSKQHLEPIFVDYSCQDIPSPTVAGQRPTPILEYDSVFNPRYTFDTFVVGSSNRFAHAAAMAVADDLSRSYNPLFLYGGSGLGKTHLMQAIGASVVQKDPFRKVTYVSAEKFTDEFIHMMRQGRLEAFKTRYRTSDLLLIDDIQFLINKERIQEEFFHTFNTLHEAGKQIVISSDRPPSELTPLEERLRSRFGWGLTVDINPPDWETRCAILQQKAADDKRRIADEVIYFIADNVKANIRELEGALNKVMYYSSQFNHNEVDLRSAQEALRDLVVLDETPRMTIAGIQKLVADAFGISVDDMKSSVKSRNVAFPRQIAMYLCRDSLGATLPQIGRDFGGRDHSTVIHACDKISAQRMHDPDINKQLREFEAMINK